MSRSTYQERINHLKESNPFISQSDVAHTLIAEEILNGTFQPGDRVGQENLATLLQMSRTPVRDALVRLEQDGLIVQSEKGYQVYSLNIKDYVDYSELRIRIESYAAYLAARFITQEQLTTLKINLEQYILAHKEGDAAAAGPLDVEFHDIIVNACSNHYVIQVYQSMMLKKQFYMRYVMHANALQSATKKHLDIYKALVARDEHAAEAAMRSHLSFYMHSIYNTL